MDIDGTRNTLERALERLRQDDAPPWPDRARLASQLGDCLRSVRAPDALAACVRLLHALAEDEKWEVRKAAAESLMHLRSDDFDALASRLANDANAWVRKAAERTLARRKRLEQVETKKRQRIEGVFDDYDWFVEKYGRTAADRALRIGERYFEILASAATHEIRGILTSLSGALEQLGKDGLSANEHAAGLEKARERTAFLNRILDDMKGYAQELSCDFRRENLREIVEAAIDLVGDKVRSADRTLADVDVANEVAEFVSLEASRYQLVQVFENVIRNAFESTDEDGRIRISSDLADEKCVVVSVADNGVGMSPEEEKDAFIPFRTSKKNQGGTGFGLAIAKKIVLAHGGTIVMQSAEDRGTTVKITLPLTQQDRLDA